MGKAMIGRDAIAVFCVYIHFFFTFSSFHPPSFGGGGRERIETCRCHQFFGGGEGRKSRTKILKPLKTKKGRVDGDWSVASGSQKDQMNDAATTAAEWRRRRRRQGVPGQKTIFTRGGTRISNERTDGADEDGL
jgi:hypothetical protein